MSDLPFSVRDLAAVARDLLDDCDPSGDDPSYDAARDVLDSYDRFLAAGQMTLGIDEEETE